MSADWADEEAKRMWREHLLIGNDDVRPKVAAALRAAERRGLERAAASEAESGDRLMASASKFRAGGQPEIANDLESNAAEHFAAAVRIRARATASVPIPEEKP